MSGDPVESSVDDLPYASPRPTWRDQLAALAESLDVTPRRVALAVLALAVAAVMAWRLLAPAPAPAEMSLPYTAGAGPEGAPAAGDGAGPGVPGASGPAGAAASGTGAAAGPSGAPGSPAAAGGAGEGQAGTASGTGGAVVVHVAGAVARPGVQPLGAGARVVDAVDRAGGAAPDADLARVNLAAPLNDGEQVYIPRLGEAAPPPLVAPAAPAATGPAGTGSSAGDAAGPVNINTATAEQLDTLPGVGPATAEAIIAHRQEHGPFTAVDQLLDVRGIGDAKLAELRDLVTV
jgi:competence protein ComEA